MSLEAKNGGSRAAADPLAAAPLAAGPLADIAAIRPGFDVIEPLGLSSPLVFSSPHSGRDYPPSFLAATKLEPLMLRRSEDAHVDALFGAAAEFGAPMLRAQFPRAFLDVNREPYELDPRMFAEPLPPYANTRSIRVAGGLGTIARVVGEAREIYQGRLSVAEGLARIEQLYKPYHAQLRQLMQRAERNFGRAVLIDCHSMPSTLARGSRYEERLKADIVLGDRYGTSCDASVVDAAERELRRCGYNVVRNKPYAGGFITEHYGNVSIGWHALQIELNRSLYMDEATMERTPGFARLAGDMANLIEVLAHAAEGLAGDRRAAAE